MWQVVLYEGCGACGWVGEIKACEIKVVDNVIQHGCEKEAVVVYEGSFVWCVDHGVEYARVIGRKMAVAHSTTFFLWL